MLSFQILLLILYTETRVKPIAIFYDWFSVSPIVRMTSIAAGLWYSTSTAGISFPSASGDSILTCILFLHVSAKRLRGTDPRSLCFYPCIPHEPNVLNRISGKTTSSNSIDVRQPPPRFPHISSSALPCSMLSRAISIPTSTGSYLPFPFQSTAKQPLPKQAKNTVSYSSVFSWFQAIPVSS